MDKVICLDKDYSTTQRLTQEKSIIKNNPKDTFKTTLPLPENENRIGKGGLRTKGYFKKSYENKPLLSIITVVFNGEKYLEQTIQSVINQTYDNVEYIIIDGGSSDRTIGIIKKYNEQIDYWISEKDAGIYDAMNKGIKLAVGEYIGFLNADDWYNKESLEIVIKTSEDAKPGYIFGDMDLYNENQLVGLRKANLQRYKLHTPIGHQALFVQRKYLQEIPFDINYKIIADYDFMIKLIKQKISYIQIDKTLANFRMAGLSSVVNYDKERFQIQYHHFGLIRAMYGFILETKIPIISHIVKGLVYIKHKIEGTNK